MMYEMDFDKCIWLILLAGVNNSYLWESSMSDYKMVFYY